MASYEMHLVFHGILLLAVSMKYLTKYVLYFVPPPSQKVEARSRASRSADIIAEDMNDLSSGKGRFPTAA